MPVAARRSRRQKTLIYGMLDPLTQRIRYIGLTTTSLDTRRGWHLKDDRPCPRVVWIQSLLKQGLSPIMILLEEVPYRSKADDRERWWIAFGREANWDLLNVSDGGDGATGYHNRSGRGPKRPQPAN